MSRGVGKPDAEEKKAVIGGVRRVIDCGPLSKVHAASSNRFSSPFHVFPVWLGARRKGTTETGLTVGGAGQGVDSPFSHRP